MTGPVAATAKDAKRAVAQLAGYIRENAECAARRRRRRRRTSAFWEGGGWAPRGAIGGPPAIAVGASSPPPSFPAARPASLPPALARWAAADAALCLRPRERLHPSPPPGRCR